MPGKVKHFLWRACTNSLPKKINLVKRRVLSDLVCHLCGRADEDTFHALWGCEAVKQGWDRDFNWVNQFEAAQGSFQDLVAKVLSKPRMREVFATTAWFIWAHRNKSRLNEKTLPLSGIRDAVSNFLQLFRSCREPPVSNKVMRRRKWTPPNPGDYKVNFDGAMFNESDEAGVGIVVRTLKRISCGGNGGKNHQTAFCEVSGVAGSKARGDFCKRNWVTTVPL